MRRNGWVSLGMVVALMGMSDRVAARDLKFFYCYAPDPTKNTVHVSPVMPIGPVDERRRYGDEFVAHLVQRGRLGTPVQGYCSMKTSAEQVAAAQAKLHAGNCLECGGAARFEPVEWPRAGKASPSPAAGLAAARPAAPASAPPIEILDFASAPPERQPMLVVMGNGSTGKVVVLRQPDSASADAIERRYAGQGGWKRLLITGGAGHGAAACAAVQGRIEFFVVHEQGSEEEAQLRARQFALQSVDDPLIIQMCHPGWVAGAPGDDEKSLLDTGVEQSRQRVLDAMACNPKRQPCPPPTRPAAVGVRG